VIVDMVCRSVQGESGMVSALIARRKRLPHDARYLMPFVMHRVVDYVIYSGLGYLVARLIDFGHRNLEAQIIRGLYGLKVTVVGVGASNGANKRRLHPSAVCGIITIGGLGAGRERSYPGWFVMSFPNGPLRRGPFVFWQHPLV
jgi:hypothetical protein